MAEPACPYVSRGGIKLAAALQAFGIPVAGLICADLGASTGGFTDCLLQHGAARVYAVDTAYGQLDWKLRNDPRVIVLERTNAVHFDPRLRNETPPQPSTRRLQAPTGSPPSFTGCDLVVIDLGWTRQGHAIPAAVRWLKKEQIAPSIRPNIISLIKPHYEAEREMLRGRRGVLDDAQAQAVLEQTLAALPGLGVRVLGHIPSPIRGSGDKGKAGNIEYLAWLEPLAPMNG